MSLSAALDDDLDDRPATEMARVVPCEPMLGLASAATRAELVSRSPNWENLRGYQHGEVMTRGEVPRRSTPEEIESLRAEMERDLTQRLATLSPVPWQFVFCGLLLSYG